MSSNQKKLKFNKMFGFEKENEKKLEKFYT